MGSNRNKAYYNYSFMKIIKSGFTLFLLLLWAGSVMAQHVHSYPQDGKIKDLKGKVQQDIVVAKDGSGDFLYIQDALEAIRVYLPKPITVYIKEGIYKEKLEIPGTITNVTFKGDGPEKTIITFDDHTGKNYMDTFDSHTLLVWGNSLTFKDMTIQNTAGSVGQAVALHAEGDRLVFDNCHFKGDQDTMFASGENSRQYYKNCYIEGTTDFIFGSATALFENCEIHSKSNSYITAASTPKWVEHGYVFKDCQLTAAEGVDRVFLGRPWRDYAQTVFINCEMGDHIVPEGWNDWGRSQTHETTFYAEYQSQGPGANPDARVDWSHQLSEEEAKAYTMEQIFEGNTQPVNGYGFPWYGYERDSSFNLKSAYEHNKKDFPQIKPVYPSSISMKGIKEKREVSYKDLGYRELKMDVFYPSSKPKKSKPGIVMVHGGGWRSGNKILQVPMAKALAAEGYVTAAVEYRLSLEAPYPAGVQDVKDAIKWLKAHATEFGLDTGKIAISGSSAGGQLAALVGFTNGKTLYETSPKGPSSDVQAVIEMDGVLAFHHPESAEGEVAAQWLGGTYEEVPEIWEEASALHQVGPNAVPILFINSQYPRFHAGRDDMIKKLDEMGIYSKDFKHHILLFVV